MALLHVSFPPGQACGGEDILYIFLIFPGHLEFLIPLQIPIWSAAPGCTLLQCEMEVETGWCMYKLWKSKYCQQTTRRWGEAWNRPTTYPQKEIYNKANEKMKYGHLWQYEWALRIPGYVKKIKQKKLRIMWFHSYEGYKTNNNKEPRKTKIPRHKKTARWLPEGKELRGVSEGWRGSNIRRKNIWL